MGAFLDYVGSDGLTPLMHCCSHAGLDDVAAQLIEAGAKPDLLTPFGWSALTVACFSGRAASAQRLVDKGAALNLLGSDGKTALDWASEKCPGAAAAIMAKGGLTGSEVREREAAAFD